MLDLFTCPAPMQPAPCGFVPMHGWSTKWAREDHIQRCHECAIAAIEQEAEPREQ